MINILPKWIDAESATPFFFIDRKDSKIYSDVGGCVSSQRKLFWFCFRCFSKNERTLLILSAHAWRSPPVVAPLYGHGSAGVQSSPMRISNGTKRLIKSDIANDRRARSQRCELSASRHIEQHKGDRAQRPQQIYPRSTRGAGHLFTTNHSLLVCSNADSSLAISSSKTELNELQRLAQHAVC